MKFSSKELGWMVASIGMLMPHISSKYERIGLLKLETKLTVLLNQAREEDKRELEKENTKRESSG